MDTPNSFIEIIPQDSWRIKYLFGVYNFIVTYSVFAGVWKPRRAKDGSELPSAKQVSEYVHRPSYEEDQDFTVMLAVWGQFMDHDITATALSRGETPKRLM